MNGTCKVITSTNVFQHTEPIGNFASGVWHALRDDGIWCLEFPYWGMTWKHINMTKFITNTSITIF